MRKFVIVAAAIGLSMGVAVAQPSQPQGGANTGPTSNTADAPKDGMMKKDSMSKDGMKTDGMAKGGETKDGNGMMNKGMSK